MRPSPQRATGFGLIVFRIPASSTLDTPANFSNSATLAPKVNPIVLVVAVGAWVGGVVDTKLYKSDDGYSL